MENTCLMGERKKTVFQIKFYHPEHKCKGVKDSLHISSAFLARKYLDTFRNDPDLKWKIFARMMRRDIGFTIAKFMAYRTKRKVLEKVHDEFGEHYLVIKEYCRKILETNREVYQVDYG